MPQGPNRCYEIVDAIRAETPARLLELSRWPRRGFLCSSLSYQEWFDWSELFSSGAPQNLLAIVDRFSASGVRIACLLTDNQSLDQPNLKVISIKRDDLVSHYFQAIWDEEYLPPSLALALVSRLVLVWDETGRWIVVNDRFFEIGLFAILDSCKSKLNERFFESFDEQALLERFSKILRTNKVGAFAELNNWLGTAGGPRSKP